MTGFWALLLSGLACWGLSRWDMPVGFLIAVGVGVVAAIYHVLYNYEEIACTCDDPDHEH
jgi:hypothetical protein